MPVITQAAEKIKRFLRSRHKEQADLAREVGLSTAAVTHWMKGRRVPARKHIKWLVEWSEGYLSESDFDTPYRRNVAIPEPPPPASSLPKTEIEPVRKLAQIVFDPVKFTVQHGEGAGMGAALDALQFFINEGKQPAPARIVKTNFDELLDYHIVTHPGRSSC